MPAINRQCGVRGCQLALINETGFLILMKFLVRFSKLQYIRFTIESGEIE